MGTLPSKLDDEGETQEDWRLVASENKIELAFFVHPFVRLSHKSSSPRVIKSHQEPSRVFLVNFGVKP